MAITCVNDFAAIIRKRRSIRKLAKDASITRSDVEELMKLALYSPCAFNMQSSRMVLLMDEQHVAFWTLVKDTLRGLIPEERFAATDLKLAGFQSGVGTVLFFEDQTIVQDMQQRFTAYQNVFPIWSQHNNAILQHAIWLLFAERDIAVSLQHYNPVIDDMVKARWQLPAEWLLVAQMPFGRANETPAERSFLPFSEVVRSY